MSAPGRLERVAGRVGRSVYPVLVMLAGGAIVWIAHAGQFTSKDAGAGLFALLGTFLGALLAFRLQESKDAATESRRRKAALNRALLVLSVQRNEIHQYALLIAPYRTPVELAFNFPASQPAQHNDFAQKFDDLDFLLDCGTPQVLLDLMIEDDRFRQAMEAIRTRNEFMVQHVQPALAQLGINGTQVTSEQLENALGEYLYGGAMQGANTLRNHVLACEDSLPAAFHAIRRVAKQLFPKEKFLQVEIREPTEMLPGFASVLSDSESGTT